MENSYVLLIVLLFIGVIGKNQSFIIATSFLILLKSLKINPRFMDFIAGHGVNIGIIIMTIAVLTPIATDKIDLKAFVLALKSPFIWIALLSGVLVSILGREGVKLLTTTPELTVALVLGTIISVAVFKGVAVGPLIGAGIAYVLISAFKTFL